MPMTEGFVLFNYFESAQSVPFAFRKSEPFCRENSAICGELVEQSLDCMQRIHAVAIARIVTRALRTRRHLDGSYSVCDGR